MTTEIRVLSPAYWEASMVGVIEYYIEGVTVKLYRKLNDLLAEGFEFSMVILEDGYKEEVTGPEYAEKIRETFPNVKILAIISDGDRASNFTKLGIATLESTYSLHELLAKIRQILASV